MFHLRKLIAGLLLVSGSAFAWNNIGHQLVAQIAWDHMTPEARAFSNEYNKAFSRVYPASDFVQASTWLDTIRYRNIKWYNYMHYLDWPFTEDDSPLPAVNASNALSAINHALIIMSGKYAKNFDRGFALRVLIHVVADIHQPLHATTRISAEYPSGDAGGNYFPIKARIAKNLHAYWDKGGGTLLTKDKSDSYIQERAKQLTLSFPCNTSEMDLDPKRWLSESHTIGVYKAYALSPNSTPSNEYEKEAQSLSEQRVALAGCRLAALLNSQYLSRNRTL